MKVKVCGLNNQVNALKVALAGVDMVGFIFHPNSPRFIQQPFDNSFYDAAPKSVKRVGVFVDAPEAQVLDCVMRYSLDYVQLHGAESPDYCLQLQAKGVPVIKAFAVGDNFDFRITKAFSHSCSMFLFDALASHKGGNGITFSWNLLSKYELTVPFLLSGGVSIDHLSALKALMHPALVGFDINSRFEVSPGVKDIVKVSEFVESVKQFKHNHSETHRI